MKIQVNACLGTLVLFAASAAAAQTCDLNKTLAQMDSAAATFKSAQADFTWDEYDAVVREDDLQSGTIYFARHGANTSVAADITRPAAKQVTFDGSNLVVYTPSAAQELIYSAAKNKDLVEGFLTLGFGGSGADLKKSWDVTCAGTETIAGTPTVKLALVSKNQSVKTSFSTVTIWVDPVRDVSLKQVFEQSSGDKRTNTFTNIKLNAKIDAHVFSINIPKGTAITRK